MEEDEGIRKNTGISVINEKQHRRKRQKSIHVYMTTHFPGLVQAPQYKVVGLN
jgi:hypothetical protein